MLELTGVTKVYKGGRRAVDGISLALGPGMLGLLGPNGAGKSTLMRIIATVTRPTAGTLTYDGTDLVAKPDTMRRQLGYLPQDFGVYPNLTAREFLAYLAAGKGLSARAAKARIGELLELVNLTEAARRPLGGYSGGMLRRVGIAQALLGDPRVIVVDEPTAGLDPEERLRFRNLLGSLATDRLVLLSTHIVSDIETMAAEIPDIADIAVVAGGRLLRRGTVDQLLHQLDGCVWELLIDPDTVPAVQDRYPVSRMVRTPAGVRVRLVADRAPGRDADRVAPDLEDAYLGIVRGASTPHAGGPAHRTEVPR